MTRYIVIKTQFEAIHNWPDCDIEEVEFLKYPHRHIFYLQLKFKISHNNRDKEFISIKRSIEEIIREKFAYMNLGSMSCEDIAEYFSDRLNAEFVSVLEDDENGAEIYKI